MVSTNPFNSSIGVSEGITINATGHADTIDRIGLTLGSGFKLIQSGGTINAIGTCDPGANRAKMGIGLAMPGSDFYQVGGILTATGTGGTSDTRHGSGMIVRNIYVSGNGKIIAIGTSGASSSNGDGMQVSGSINLSENGVIEATGNGNPSSGGNGMTGYESVVTMDGGQFIATGNGGYGNSNSENSIGRGLYFRAGTIIINDGKLIATGNGEGFRSTGVGISIKDITINGGHLIAIGNGGTVAGNGTGTSSSYGKGINTGPVIQDGGIIEATGNGRETYAYGFDGNFTQNSGIIIVVGNGGTTNGGTLNNSGYGYGIFNYGATNSFTTNSTVYASGFNDVAAGVGIYSEGGFIQGEDGKLFLMPGTGTSVYVNKLTDLSGAMRPYVDFLDTTTPLRLL